MKRLAYLANAAFLTMVPHPALADELAAINAQMNLNNYIAAIEFADSCLGTEEGRKALKPIRPKIESARKALHNRYPAITADSGFDTDYVCRRESGTQMDQRRIRREAERLIQELQQAVSA